MNKTKSTTDKEKYPDVHCFACEKTIAYRNYSKHKKTMKHIKNETKLKTNLNIQDIDIEQLVLQKVYEVLSNINALKK